ncbi:DUF445 domain-containing protein [Paenibacillus sanguinis]|uniref:DUF445 domain-containing protein n=1 Tax=Paenibacillus sanguinis TaxID=225906 RepID=UPI0003803F47|nr:DUF445 family protein [Paenibacillus sanguinis]
MQDWLYILVSILVAAFVGGVTNHFAIKMLFHPRNAVHIGKLHVPFTPGLIPKRRDDIALSLGKVVSEYLVTVEGLQETVLRPAFRQRLEDKVQGWFGELSNSDLTVKEAALRIWSEAELEALKINLANGARQAALRGFQSWWEQSDAKSIPLKQLVPGWSEENRKVWSAVLAGELLRVAEEELLSAGGQRMLSRLASGMMDKTGGFLGTMAAIFVDEEKLVQKITPAAVQALRSKQTLDKTAQAIEARMQQYGELPAAELLGVVTGQEAGKWLEEHIGQWPIYNWITRVEELKVSAFVEPWREQAAAGIPRLTERVLTFAASVIPAVIQAVGLPQLVEEQVKKFPVERLEEIILGISGKEFRAITWLGAVLGGIIGLFQAIFMLLTN